MDYPFGDLQYAGREEKNILSTGLRNAYFIVPDDVYEIIDYPVNKVFAYEVDHWTEKLALAETILSRGHTKPDLFT